MPTQELTAAQLSLLHGTPPLREMPARCPADAARPAAATGKGRRVSTSVTLDVDIETMWRAIQTPALLLRVTEGLMRFDLQEPAAFPEIWDAQTYHVELRMFGWWPIGRQVIAIERPAWDGARRMLRDNAHGDICNVWEHLMILEPVEGGRTRYTDALRVEAGWRTIPTAAYAYCYYSLRQRKLKKLIREGLLD